MQEKQKFQEKNKNSTITRVTIRPCSEQCSHSYGECFAQ